MLGERADEVLQGPRAGWARPGRRTIGSALAATIVAAQGSATWSFGRDLEEGIATNLMMLGFAWQRGLIPLAEAAILRAIELNGVAVEANQRAFAWGRRLAARPAEVNALLMTMRASAAEPETLDSVLAHRSGFLEGYQGKRLAGRYRALVERVAEASRPFDPRRARSRSRSPATTPSSWRIRTSTRSRGSTPAASSRSISASSSRATSSSRCTSRRRSSPASIRAPDGPASAASAPG